MKNKTVLITGSAGFIGTNLTKWHLANGDKVIGIDNFSSADKWKSSLHSKNKNYKFLNLDISKSFSDEVKMLSGETIDYIYNLACPASPPRYQALPLETIAVNTLGIINVLDLALDTGAKVLQASTSEVYGDPLEHPQKETYRGNVNTVGPRSCYDEGKRIAETICYEYKKKGVDIKIARFFNTYGPFMDPDDGRVVTNFILQSINNKNITIFGKGSQTRSFQYIDDLITAITTFISIDNLFGPLNIGNPGEFTILELAEIVLELTKSKSKLVFKDLPADDPLQRRPDITEAKEKLSWVPKVQLKEGLKKTINYFKNLEKFSTN